jgi:endoglucanase
LTGEQRYLETGLRQMHWLLGRNGLGVSFVTGQGKHSAGHPYHWTGTALGKLMPGWAAGGPNQHLEPRIDALLRSLIERGTPPAKCYLDANACYVAADAGSWASNEGETSENAALVFAAGYLSADY